MLPNAYICHESPGRVRLRIPEKKYDHDYFARVQEVLSKLNYTSRVVGRVLTASLVIEHVTELASLLIDAKELGLFACAPSTSEPAKENTTPPLADIMQAPWVVKGLMVLGTIQILRGIPLAPGSTLFMDAYRLWTLNQSR